MLSAWAHFILPIGFLSLKRESKRRQEKAPFHLNFYSCPAKKMILASLELDGKKPEVLQ
jgi:hypothetical protein